MKHAVFIPGLGESAKAYAHQMTHLQDLIEPTVFDYDAFDNTEDMVASLIPFLKPKTTLIGHSMGGFLAQKCAAKTPELIEKLILINTWADHRLEFQKQNQLALEAIDMVGLEPIIREQIPLLMYDKKAPLVEEAIQALLEKPPETYKRLFRALSAGEDLTSSLSKITAPTLIIHGRQDPLFSLDQHLHMLKHIPKASLTIIEESGHNSPLEQPQAVTALIRLFLSRT